MNTTGPQSILSRKPLTALGWLTFGSLVVIALGFGMLLVSIGIMIVPIAIVGVAALVVAGLALTGVRWMPALAAVFGVGVWIGGLTSQPYSLYHLTHPHEGLPFIVSIIIYVSAIVTVVAGIGATIEQYRVRAGEVSVANRKLPGWANIFLGVLVGFVLGAGFISVLPENAPRSATASEPGTVHMDISTFSVQSITIPKGSMLRLVDDGSFQHIIANGSWDGTTPKPGSEPGAPAVKDVQVNGGNIVIGPFTTAGTFSIYCTIHPGMTLKVIVQ